MSVKIKRLSLLRIFRSKHTEELNHILCNTQESELKLDFSSICLHLLPKRKKARGRTRAQTRTATSLFPDLQPDASVHGAVPDVPTAPESTPASTPAGRAVGWASHARPRTCRRSQRRRGPWSLVRRTQMSDSQAQHRRQWKEVRGLDSLFARDLLTEENQTVKYFLALMQRTLVPTTVEIVRFLPLYPQAASVFTVLLSAP